MPTVAESVVNQLHAAGVRHVFGLPGGETVNLLEALRQKDIAFHLVHNESSALFMADALARIAGIPGVCLTTLGPGATNATVGLSHAYLDRSPLLLFTAQKPDHLLPDYTHQVIDLHALFAPITKATWQLRAENAAELTAKALHLIQDGRPGPVHLQLSNEEAGLPANDSEVNSARFGNGQAKSIVPTIDMERARQLLSTAQRPLLIAGLGVEPQRPYAALRALAETLGAPVIATPKAKGALPDDADLAAGVIGLTMTDPAYSVVDEADCIVAIGFDVVELVKPWQHSVPFIWVAGWENHDPRIDADVELVGDLSSILYELCETTVRPHTNWGTGRIATRETARPSMQPRQGTLFPQTVLEQMRNHMDPNAVLAVDVGSHKILSSLEWPTLEPNRFLLSNGLSSMGYALPAAIGASLALDRAPTVCLTGDAGFSMVMGELALLKSLELPVIVVVFNDGAIDLIRAQQVRAGNPVFGTEFTPPEFHKISAAYGIPARRVRTVGDFSESFAIALGSDQPAVIEVMLDPTSYPTTPRDLQRAA